MTTVERNETYEFIGDLAMCLYLKNIKISFTALHAILADTDKADRLTQYEKGRGVANGVKGAFYYWGEKDPVVHHAIAHVFTNKDGVLAWLAYE